MIMNMSKQVTESAVQLKSLKMIGREMKSPIITGISKALFAGCVHCISNFF